MRVLALIAVIAAQSFGQQQNSQPVPVQDSATGTVGSAAPTKAIQVAAVTSTGLVGITACNSYTALQMTTATTTQIVALVAGQKVRVCSYSIQGSTTSTATTLKFVQGTGTNCATGLATISPAWNMAASNFTINWAGSGLGELFSTIAGNALCATSSAAGTVNIGITYTVY